RFRAFCDSAPVMEVALANRAKLGWRGKNTLLLNRQSGSMFFLGSLFINMPLERLPQALLSGPGSGDTEHCGSCRACLDVCPTQALVAPFQLDARRCISYLTIEHSGPIPEGLRSAIGNRIYGCDDCQLICPWNKFAVAMPIKDFAQRPELENLSLIEALTWSEDEFSRRTEGSAIRRIGHRRWQRNVVVALGNFLAGRVTHHAGTPKPTSGANLQALKAQRREARQALARARLEANTMLAEHIDWALSCSST
ncbi:MAG: tRNA epoxyqueuosine(34) reductase QueG, partial [Betaproteobacteria bacterium]|nr:tRNA epoxyqueuosine(34) reductase QueG [Betaproteobacteria bacterium]